MTNNNTTKRVPETLERDWAKSLSRRTIVAVTGAVGNDGHSIYDAPLFLKLGLPENVVEHFNREHQSGAAPKETLYGPQGAVPTMKGIYGAELLQGLARSLGLVWKDALGRGSEARNVTSAIRLWLGEYKPVESSAKQGD